MNHFCGRFLLFLGTFLFLIHPGLADSIQNLLETKNYNQAELSPDKLWIAVTRAFVGPERGAVWRDGSSNTCLLVRQVEATELDHEFVEWEDPAVDIVKIAWSPSSRFLVIVCSNKNGHQPWAFLSLILDVRDYSLRSVKPLGTMVAKDFKFTGPDTVQLKTGEPSSPNAIDFDLASHISELPIVAQLKAEQHD